MAGRHTFRALVAKTLTPAQQDAAHARADAMMRAIPGQRVQHARALTQATLGQLLDLPQPDVARLEQTTDMYVSTLRRFIHAMNGELEIIAHFPDGAVEITQFADVPELSELADTR